MKSSHLLSPASTASTASISASEVKVVLSSWMPFLGHFDIRPVWKWNRNHLRTLWNVASGDLKTASEVKSQESMYFWPQKEAKAIQICHSSCKYIILATKNWAGFSSLYHQKYRIFYIWGCRGCVRKTTQKLIVHT